MLLGALECMELSRAECPRMFLASPGRTELLRAKCLRMLLSALESMELSWAECHGMLLGALECQSSGLDSAFIFFSGVFHV